MLGVTEAGPEQRGTARRGVSKPSSLADARPARLPALAMTTPVFNNYVQLLIGLMMLL